MRILKWAAGFVVLSTAAMILLGAIVGPQKGNKSDLSRMTEAVAVGEPIAPWPFKPKSVILSCDQPKNLSVRVRRVFVETPDGKTYAVNGAARPFAPITTPIEKYSDTSAIIFRGLKLCDDSDDPIIIREAS